MFTHIAALSISSYLITDEGRRKEELYRDLKAKEADLKDPYLCIVLMFFCYETPNIV